MKLILTTLASAWFPLPINYSLFGMLYFPFNKLISICLYC